MIQIAIPETIPGPLELPGEYSREEFEKLCAANDVMRLERTAGGKVIMMPPAGMETSFRNSDITGQLRTWARKDGRGRALDSSAGFELPNGAIRSPDASWIRKDRLAKLGRAEKRSFAPICPDFVIELRSPSDSLPQARAKMEEWIEQGAQLGWLIDPDKRSVEIYRPDRAPELLKNPERVEGDGPVAGFVLDLAEIWAEL